MSAIKDLKLARKAATQHHQVIAGLEELAKDIERSEKTMAQLKSELEEANQKYPNPRTTREDVAYLAALLECAKKKLAWEKLITSLQKRTPSVMEQMTKLLNDPVNAPAEPLRSRMLQSLQSVQAAMERLQSVSPTQPNS